jgi:hypothetical protein
VSFPLLKFPDRPIPQLEPKWFAFMRDFLATIHASIEIDDCETPRVQRLQKSSWTPSKRQGHSQQRKYGASITAGYTFRRRQYQTLRQLQAIGWTQTNSKANGQCKAGEVTVPKSTRRPEGALRMLWRCANKMWSNAVDELHQPLGDWTITSIHQHHQRQFCYWSWNNLWVRTTDSYVRCDPEDLHNFNESDDVDQWEDIPSDATPMEVHLLVAPGKWTWTNATYTLVPSPPNTGSFSDFVDRLPEWENEILSHTQLATDTYSVSVALEHGIHAVSDGSEWFKTQGSF